MFKQRKEFCFLSGHWLRLVGDRWRRSCDDGIDDADDDDGDDDDDDDDADDDDDDADDDADGVSAWEVKAWSWREISSCSKRQRWNDARVDKEPCKDGIKSLCSSRVFLLF